MAATLQGLVGLELRRRTSDLGPQPIRFDL